MNHMIRRVLKSWMATLLYGTGILRLLVETRLRGRAIVLMYHRVLPVDQQARSYSAAAMFVSPTTFDRHMRFLRRKFNPVSLERFIDLLERNEAFPPRTCLVTFDDGWRDNLHFALPVLERHGVPAALFVSTGVIDGGSGFWQEWLTQLLVEIWRTGGMDTELALRLGIREDHFSKCKDQAAAKVLARDIVSRLKREPREMLDELVLSVEQRLALHGVRPARPDTDAFMSWADVRRLGASGLVSIGSHGESHVPLPSLATESVRTQAVGSRACIGRRLGTPVSAFAYPNGDHDSGTCRVIREAGYRLAFTTRRGPVSVGDDSSRLSRIGIHGDALPTVPLLLCRMVGLF